MLLTCQTRMRLSEYPEKRVWPSADQARERHCGGMHVAVPGTSGRSSSTMFLLSRSQILMVGPVAAHSQYLGPGVRSRAGTRCQVTVSRYQVP